MVKRTMRAARLCTVEPLGVQIMLKNETSFFKARRRKKKCGMPFESQERQTQRVGRPRWHEIVARLSLAVCASSSGPKWNSSKWKYAVKSNWICFRAYSPMAKIQLKCKCHCTDPIRCDSTRPLPIPNNNFHRCCFFLPLRSSFFIWINIFSQRRLVSSITLIPPHSSICLMRVWPLFQCVVHPLLLLFLSFSS